MNLIEMGFDEGGKGKNMKMKDLVENKGGKHEVSLGRGKKGGK